MVQVEFLLGRTCVGKTTYALSKLGDTYSSPKEYICFSRPANTLLVSTGGIARQILTDLGMANGKNPLSPEQAETRVRAGVVDAINEAKILGIDHVIVDSMPRHPEQAIWIKALPQRVHDAEVSITFLATPELERKTRIEQRRGEDEDRAVLTVERERMEASQLFDTLQQAMMLAIPINVNDGVHVIDTSSRDLGAMFQKHAEFSDLVTRKFGVTLQSLRQETLDKTHIHPYEDSMVWTSRFLKAAQEELREALQEIPEEWWTKDSVDLNKLRIELIDVWHFLMSAVMSAGMDAEMFATIYNMKREINIKRQDSNYRKRK